MRNLSSIETQQQRKSAEQRGSQGGGNEIDIEMRSVRRESYGTLDGMRPRARITSYKDRGEQEEAGDGQLCI